MHTTILTKTTSRIFDDWRETLKDSVNWEDNDNFKVTLDNDQLCAVVCNFKFRARKIILKEVNRAYSHYLMCIQAKIKSGTNDEDQDAFKQQMSKELFRDGGDSYPESNHDCIIEVDEKIIPLQKLSNIKANKVGKLICCECVIIGQENQQSVLDYYKTENGSKIFCDDYNKKSDGNVFETFFEDTQFLLCEEEQASTINPRKIPLRVYGNYVGTFEIGDRVKIIGIYSLDGVPPPDELKDTNDSYDYYITGISVLKLDDTKEVQISPEQKNFFKKEIELGYDEFFQKLTQSFAPHIIENDIAKMLCFLVAVGATPIGEHRHQIHGYLCGDPATGKSELVKAMFQLRYKSAITDAPNSSSRGLIYGQDEFQKHKILKAGLLVKNELVCIDELDKFKGADRMDMNSVLEQQIASYHKVPFDRDTVTNVSVLVTGNPANGKWNDSKTLMDNFKPIEPEILSRMMVVRTFKSSSTEKRIKHILSHVRNGETKSPYSTLELKAYISFARKLTPVMTDEAEEKIIEFLVRFNDVKQNLDVNISLETRQELELIRISCAFAKLLFREKIDKECVNCAIQFFSNSMATLGVKTDNDTVLVQMNLQDSAQSRDDTFLIIVNNLSKLVDDGTFTEFDLLQSMIETDHWRTPESCRSYWTKRLGNSEFYEPKAGRYKRV